MTIVAARIRESGVNFVVVKVNRKYLTTTALTRESIQYFRSVFNAENVILMAETIFGDIEYAGRRDIVQFLLSVSLDRIPFEKFHIS